MPVDRFHGDRSDISVAPVVQERFDISGFGLVAPTAASDIVGGQATDLTSSMANTVLFRMDFLWPSGIAMRLGTMMPYAPRDESNSSVMAARRAPLSFRG